MSDGTERTSPQLNCTLSAGLWAILQEHSRETNEPVSHIVSRALAEYLQVSHSTLYQVSTATALVEGIYQGAVRVRTLREQGDLGLGTFENLDGEMMIVDGRFFQARSDGLVKEVDDDVLCPFAVVTRFAPDSAIVLPECPDLRHLVTRFDRLRHSDNFFFALRVEGQFAYVRTRAMCRTEEGVIQSPDQIPSVLKQAFDTSGPILVGVYVDDRDNRKMFEQVDERSIH
jgi:acetolactate decarboxylase